MNTKRAVSKRTEEVLRRVINYLAEEPKRLDMGNWGTFFPEGETEFENFNEDQQPVPPCGTTGCVAGTCLLVTKAGINFLKEEGCTKINAVTQEETITFPWETVEKAAKILRISKEQASRLFYFAGWDVGEEGWPKKFEKRYNEAKTAKGRFLATKARIEYFIKTGQ